MELWWCLTLLLSLISVVYTQNVHKRFEYKYSFKGPYLAQKDNQVPFWQYSGNAIASEESVRITPSLRSQKGQIWTKNPTNFEWWEVDFVFRVTGRGRIGADGLAFWFASSPGVEGPVFGSSDKWNGLAIFFDSFDNDNKRNNPYIMAMVNDGTIVYDHEHDGISQQLGGCLRDFRNKPFPVRAKIEYYKNVLTVKTQLLEYDYSKLEEEELGSSESNTNTPEASQPPDHLTTTPPPSSPDQISTTTFPIHDEYSTTTPPPYDAYATTTTAPYDMYDATTTSPYDGYEETTTAPDEEYAATTTVSSGGGFNSTTEALPTVISDDSYTLDTPDSNSAFVEPVHDSSEDGMATTWGWFETTAQPATPLTTLKPKKQRKRKKQRRRRRGRGKKKGERPPLLMIHNGMTNNDKDYEICMRAENVHIPASGYFGVSAATGGLADDHDVLKLLVSSLRSPEEMALLSTNQEDEEKFRKEFQEYQEKTKKARDEYVAQNPDAAHRETDEEYETGELRELRNIYQGQSQIHDTIRSLYVKMDEIIGRQERTLSLVSAVHTGMGGAQVVPTGQVPPPQVGGLPGDSIKRHEVDSLLNNQRDIVQTARDIKNFVSEIHQKSNQLIAHSQKAQGSVQPVGYDLHVTLNEMKEGINIVKRDLGMANQRLNAVPVGGQGCPTVSCVSTGIFVTCMVIQVALLIGYIIYRGSGEGSEGCLVRWFYSRHEHFN